MQKTTRQKITEAALKKHADSRPAFSEELTTLLQIDLLLGRRDGFQKRLSNALEEIDQHATQADRAIKH